MRSISWVAAVLLSLLIIVSLPPVQDRFIPLGGEMDRLISESRLKPQPEPPVWIDTVYKRSLFRAHRLDIYGPLAPRTESVPESVPDPVPVIVFLHGGSWIHGDKVTIRVVDRFLRRMRSAGYAVVAVNYTDSPIRGLRGPLANVRAAIRWIAAHASEYGIDPGRMGLYGVSAGGQLALMAASSMADEGFHFSFVFAECAPTDLVALEAGEAFEHSSSLRVFGSRSLRDLSPINQDLRSLPPVLLLHGGKDQVVDVDQSRRFEEALQQAGVPVELHVYPDGDHGFLNLPDSVWYEQETIALDFFARWFAAGSRHAASVPAPADLPRRVTRLSCPPRGGPSTGRGAPA